jgi:hypothetical protein
LNIIIPSWALGIPEVPLNFGNTVPDPEINFCPFIPTSPFEVDALKN